MALYSVGVVTPAAGAGAAYATLHTGTRVARIREIGAFCTAATASRVAIGRKNNTPVATTSVLGQAEDPADAAALANLDTAWSTAPTAPAQFLRRASLAGSVGAGIIWTWPERPLVIAASEWLIIWNDGAAAGSALALYVRWGE